MLFHNHFKFPRNYNFLNPGLEVKFALEEATKQGANVHFLGAEFDQLTWKRLLHETRMNVFHYLYQRISYQGMSFWGAERNEVIARSHNAEPS